MLKRFTPKSPPIIEGIIFDGTNDEEIREFFKDKENYLLKRNSYNNHAYILIYDFYTPIEPGDFICVLVDEKDFAPEVIQAEYLIKLYDEIK